MELPGQAPKSVAEEKVLIWGAGGSVGGYAVQFAKAVGYTGKYRILGVALFGWKAELSSCCNGLSSRLRPSQDSGSIDSTGL